jgi:hypothetical protein
MSITTFSDSPYYDDLNSLDLDQLSPLDKNYLRVLFKPGVSVQTRELNQAQSILQAQLDRLGRSLYRANSAVIGGNVKINSNLKYIDVEISDIDDFNNQSNLQVEYGEEPNVATAKIERIETIENASSLIRRIFIQEVSGSASILTDTIINVIISTGDSLSGAGIAATIIDRGIAIGCSLDSGIFFVKGCLASSPSQYAATAVYSSSAADNNKLPYTGFVVLKVTEKFVVAQLSEENNTNSNYIEDLSLLDNANNSLNESAPGADRYKIELELQLLNTIPNEGDFVRLAEIRSGEIVRQENSIDASGSTLEKILSQRTYEESGNYVVRDFDIEIQNSVGSGFDSKFKTWEEANQNNSIITNDNKNNYFACTISPGLAYVRGTRVELLNPITLFSEKARTLYSESNSDKLLSTAISANVGNYVSGETVAGSGLPLFDNAVVYNLYNVNTIIGNAKILTIEYKGQGSATGIAKLDVHLYDITLNTNRKFSEVTRISLSGSNQFNFNVETINGINLNNTAISTSLFKLPYNQIKTVSNFRFSEKVIVTSTSTTPTTAKFTAPGKSFDKSVTNILVYRGSSLITDFSVDNTNNDSSELNLILPSGTGTVTALVSLSNIDDLELGLKTNTTENVSATRVGTTNIFNLNNVYHAISVNNSAWKLIDDGQRPNEYVSAQVEYIGTGTVPTSPSINVTHWKFSGGNYYTVDSYRKSGTNGGKVELDEIPSYLDQRLSDVIDTRLVSGQTDRLAFDPSSVISFNIDFYLPRRDSLCVSPEGNFFFVKGDPDIFPVAKLVDEDIQCVLYELFVPAYTFSPDTIVKSRKSNKRYTMRDIGKIEKRVGTIEYYTTLSLLEKNATDKSIFQDSRERFKNGFVTDGFRNHAIGDFNNPEYRCSIDSQRGRLYPYHTGYSLPLVRSGENANITLSNNLLHFNFEEVEASGLSQQQASQFISLQPHEVISAAGFMQLYPEVDTWSDRTTNPPRTIELFPGLDDVISEIGNTIGLIGTDWSDWTTTSVNVSRTPRAQNRRGRRLTRTTNQLSTGIQTDVISENISNSLGEFITDVSIRPYMRSRAVWIKAEALKPNSQFYFFFDGTNVSNFVRSVDQTTFEASILKLNEDDGLNETTLIAKYQPNGPIKSDENGIIYAVFVVPNNDSLKFSSGEKTLKITNSPRDIEEETTSVATSKFISNGLGVTRNETIISTSVPRIQRQAVSRTRQIVRRFDPIAQTFRVDDETGIFLTGVDLYFASKPSEFNKVGVQAYLVTVKNGYPTDDIIPGSESFVKYEDINLSPIGAESSVATRFNFPQPVYVEGNTEYALVVFSESNEYNIYIAEMAGNRRDLLTNQIIANQAALGVFFTSSNKTTWNASQNRDLKFKMYRAKFNIGSTNINFNPNINTYITDVSTVAINGTTNDGWTSQSEKTTTVSAPDLTTGIRAVVEPIFDYNLGVITGFKIIKNGFGYITAPTVTVTEIGTTKSATFQAIIPSFKVAAIALNQKTINFSGKTQISNQLQLGENIYNIEVGSPLENIINPNHIITRSNQQDLTKLIVKMSTNDDRLSPIIDLNGFSLQTREYDVASSGKTSTYLTKEITLNNPSDQLDLYIDINRPTLTSNINVFVNVKDSKNQTIGSEWNPMILIDGANTGINSNRDIFSEVRYSYNPNIDFVYFTIKIEFRGSDIIDVPACQDLRVIATI